MHTFEVATQTSLAVLQNLAAVRGGFVNALAAWSAVTELCAVTALASPALEPLEAPSGQRKRRLRFAASPHSKTRGEVERVGSAGDPPAPLGDPPSGTARWRRLSSTVQPGSQRRAVPSGGSADGTGESPVLPTPSGRVAPGTKACRNRLLALALTWLCALLASAAEPLKWEEGPGYRSAAVSVATTGQTGFTRVAPAETGITFANDLPDHRSITNRHLLSGSGVAAGDADGDGWCDLYFCGLSGENVLYRNLGNWKFAAITGKAGVACPGQDSTGAVFADLDGDRDLDLLVSSFGNGVRLFMNNGKAHFTETTDQAGVRSQSGATSMALSDVDGNGTLDLYVANFRPTTIKDQPETRFRIETIDGRPVVTTVNGLPASLPEYTNRFVVSPAGNVFEYGEPDVLFLNDGQGRFRAGSFTDGSFLDEDGQPLQSTPHDWGLSVQFRDLNADGHPDLYVFNDLFTPDRIWLNDGHGKFRALPQLAMRDTATFSMGGDFADFDRDGHDDLFNNDMVSREHLKQQVQVSNATFLFWPVGLIEPRAQINRNVLQWNRGDGTFAEVGCYAGVEASEWSWGPICLDVDLDGWEDILIFNGQLRDFQNADMDEAIEATSRVRKLTRADIFRLNMQFPKYASTNLIFRNQRDLTFKEVSAQWGFDTPTISQGACLADLDNDGDLDVIANNLNEPASVYRNDTDAPRVAVRLRGLPGNTRGAGAKIRAIGGPVVQTQEMMCGGRYLGGDDALRVFAAGSATNQLRLEIDWLSGKRSLVQAAAANRVYEIDEAEATVAPRSAPAALAPIFEDVSQLIRHTHVDTPFDDLERQPLLPNRLSQMGPGVSWIDLDGDGWDDLFVASGRGGRMGVYRNNRNGGFTTLLQPPLNHVAQRDQTTILNIGSIILVGSANYEDGNAAGPCVRLFEWTSKATDDHLPGSPSSTGPLALADIDADGDLDLFVGGRVVPGRYPEPATSLLLRNQAGQFRPDAENNGLLERVGLVSAAVFTDLNGDGFPELVLACEWGPLRVFLNEQGRLSEWNPPLVLQGPVVLNAQRSTLNQLTGWWNGVTAGDLDGDGRMDLVASNWGLNSKYRPQPDRPVRLYYGDFAGRGLVDLIESYVEEQEGREVPVRGLRSMAFALPGFREMVPTFERFGQSSVQELFGDALKTANVVWADTLASMAFLNRGDRFEASRLPAEAQFTRGFGVTVGDADGDGYEDVFLSQNFFATGPETTRLDAGRGLWLRGDGHGVLRAVPGQESGVIVYGEQRGCALGDYDADGRVDLVVTQNGNATKLFHNVRAQPGLRVRLRGPPGNPTGVGSMIRLKYGERFGPAREAHAGSGYWSQDSPVQVMALPERPTQLWVRWPGGKTTLTDLPASAKEVEMTFEGAIKVVR